MPKTTREIVDNYELYSSTKLWFSQDELEDLKSELKDAFDDLTINHITAMIIIDNVFAKMMKR